MFFFSRCVCGGHKQDNPKQSLTLIEKNNKIEVFPASITDNNTKYIYKHISICDIDSAL